MKTLFNRTAGRITSIVVATLVSVSAQAVIVVPDQLEVVTIPNVGSTFQTVNLENTYTNAILVCTYNLPSFGSVPAVVRIRSGSITANSFDVQILNPVNAMISGAVTPGKVLPEDIRF